MLNALLLHELARADEQVRRGRETSNHGQPRQRASMEPHEATIGAGMHMSLDRALFPFARRTSDGRDASR
jgi:hypothetical protein